MSTAKWLVTLCLCPLAALVFSMAICGVLVVSLVIELHRPSSRLEGALTRN